MTTTEEKVQNIPTQNNQGMPKQNGNNNPSKKFQPGLKLLLIAGMCVAFLIPWALIRNLVQERQYTENKAENEVFAKWAGNQTVIGPIIEVAYTKEGVKEPVKMLLLPEQLNVKGDVSTKALKRGIYDFTVYESSLNLTGRFNLPKDFEKNSEGKEWRFEEAQVIVEITNLRGLRDNVVLNLNGVAHDMEPNAGSTGGLACTVDLSALLEGNTLDFSVKVPFKGSGNLMFAPAGQTTTINLTSDCVTPSFDGDYLPDERQVTDKGFEASWKVLAINRDYPQLMESNYTNNNRINNSTFGVELKVPVEQYQQTDRVIKYAFLVILLTFAAVFFVETRKATPIHPVQYLLIGIALILFYILLLSFSEHMSFLLSYIIASVMTIGMITVFMASVAKDKKTAMGIGILLTVLYAFVYILLQLETYALLVGSVGIFVILGIAMFATQKIDWYKKKD